ncbi:MAG: DUF2157 domain-containing protein [Nocardiopsaceae bacterium]|nr:DUF2157 domain-containing protein [Nocardiopsaceae bacterium]
MKDSDSVRQEALRGLVERGVITLEQAEAVRAALDAAGADQPRVRWAEVAGYIGGGLVLAGVFALLATSWDDLAEAARVALLLGVAVASIVGGVVMAGGPRAMVGRTDRVPTVRRRVTGMLLALAAAATAFAVGEALTDPSLLLPGAVGLAVAATGYALLPSAVGLVTAWVMSGVLAGAAVDEVVPIWEHDALPFALTLLALGVLWGVLASRGLLHHRRLGLGLGAGMAPAGVQSMFVVGLESPWAYWPTLGVALLCLVYYRWERAGVLLVFGILGITVAVPEMVWDWTDGAVTVAAVLLLAGAVLLTASWIGIRLHRDQRQGG